MGLSTERTNTVKMEFPSRPENVAFARTAVAMFASQLDFTLDDIDEIKVATSEAVSNAVIHGYRDQEGIVTVTASISADGLEVIVSDHGRGIPDVEQAMEPAFTTEPDKRMGLGFVFIKEYMDSVEVKSTVGVGTEIIMRKSPSSKDREKDLD